MRIENLKNPGTYSGGQSLRARVAHAISFAETVNRGRSGSAVSPTAKAIADFLTDAASKTPGYTGPVLPDNQAIVTSGAELAVTGGTVTLTVTDGVVAAEFTPEG